MVIGHVDGRPVTFEELKAAKNLHKETGEASPALTVAFSSYTAARTTGPLAGTSESLTVQWWFRRATSHRIRIRVAKAELALEESPKPARHYKGDASTRPKKSATWLHASQSGELLGRRMDDEVCEMQYLSLQ